MTYLSKSEKETHKIAKELAHKIINSKGAVIIALEGELGAGKTTFIRGFLGSLKIKDKIKSPTFVLMKHYKVPKSNQDIYHLDCYRVRDHRDLTILDLKTILNTPHNIVLIEWPERVSKILPKKFIRIHIDHIDKNKRKITIK